MKKLKIAIQKSGRLNSDSLRILKDCGININNGRDQLSATATNFPLELLFLRNGDIPKYLHDGVVDLAIVGENLLVEKGEDLPIIEKLGFSKCKVSVAIPKTENYTGIQDLQDKKIATSYPNTVKKFLADKGINANLHIISGSVEIAPNIGLADAIVDIVSSGNTLFKNNLKEVEKILTSESVLTASPGLGDEKQKTVDELHFRMKSVLRSKNSKYVLMNAPNDQVKKITEILPGMRSPTVLPLAEEGWSSIHSVINEETFWEVIGKLKENGAEGILVCPIEKMVL
jgi:ATP phosphoribosyltransferase